MLSVILAASIVVVMNPPEPLPCGKPGVAFRTADGSTVHAVRAEYLPSERGIVITPVLPGRVFCSGFEP